jgi:probable HAF family extracellular repeat protein
MNPSRGVHAASDKSDAANKPERFEVVDLGPFDNNRNDVLGINDHAQIVGVSLNPETGRIEAFRQEGANRSALGTLGGSFSIARALNNNGEVVGGSLTPGDGNFHGFLYRNDQMHDLNDFLEPGAGWELLQALGINNHGEIIAIGSHVGQDRIVLLRPRA